MNENMVFGDWLDVWLENRRVYVKEATLACYAVAVRNHVKPLLGSLTLSEITEHSVQDAVLHWMRQGRCDNWGGLSERTVRGLLMIVQSSLKDAAKSGLIVPVPMDIRFPKQSQTEKIQVFSKEEQMLLMQYIYMNLTPRNAGILLCMQTGLRIGEICALQWEDIDLQNRLLTVRKTLQRITEADGTRIVITTPKTRSSERSIPISSYLYPVLERLYSDNPKTYFLTGTEKPTEPRTYREFFNRVQKKLGISQKRFHCLRHTFATRLIENGADYKTVSELLGHASITTTMNLYVHPQMEQKRQAIEKIGICF